MGKRRWMGKEGAIVFLAMVALGGGVVLWRLPPHEADALGMAVTAQASEPETMSPEEADELLRLRRENEQLSRRVEEVLSSMEPPVSPSSVAHTAQGAALRQEGVARRLAGRRISVFDLDGSFSEEFYDAYGLDALARARVQAAYQNAVAALRRISALNTEGRRVDAYTYELAVSPFPEEGGAIHDRFMQELKDVLGDVRYAAFLQISAETIDRRLGGFGTQKETITATWDRETGQYLIKTPTLSTSGAYFEIVESLYPHLAHLFPPDFRSRSTREDFERKHWPEAWRRTLHPQTP